MADDVAKNADRSLQFEPLTFGAMLDRMINLYIHNFVLFFGIMLIPQTLDYATGIVFSRSLEWNNRVATVLYILLYMVITLLSFAAGTGAATVAISSRYLDREISVAAAYKQALRRLGSVMRAWIIAAILIALVFLGIVVGTSILTAVMAAVFSDRLMSIAFLLPLLIFLGAILIVGRMGASYCLITPVNLLENCTARQSRRRSRFLTRGTRWRILGILLLYLAVVLFVAYAPIVLVNLITGTNQSFFYTGKASLIHYLVSAPLQFLFAPIPAILVVLIYYNQRIRKEGFDLVLLAEALVGS